MLTSVRTPALSLRRNRRLATRGCNSLPVKNSPPFDSLPHSGGSGAVTRKSDYQKGEDKLSSPFGMFFDDASARQAKQFEIALNQLQAQVQSLVLMVGPEPRRPPGRLLGRGRTAATDDEDHIRDMIERSGAG